MSQFISVDLHDDLMLKLERLQSIVDLLMKTGTFVDEERYAKVGIYIIDRFVRETEKTIKEAEIIFNKASDRG